MGRGPESLGEYERPRQDVEASRRHAANPTRRRGWGVAVAAAAGSGAPAGRPDLAYDGVKTHEPTSFESAARDKAEAARQQEPQASSGGSVSADRQWARDRISNFFQGQQAPTIQRKPIDGAPKIYRSPIGGNDHAGKDSGGHGDEAKDAGHAQGAHGAAHGDEAKDASAAKPATAHADAGKDAGGHGDAKKSTPKAGAGPQKTSDLDQLYKDAAVAQGALFALAQAIAGECHAETKDPGLKGRPRAEEKIKSDYGGDASRIIDISRGSIVFKKADEIQRGIKLVEARAKVHRKKDRFAEPVAGYRDIMFNLEMPNGHICELQLQLEAIQSVKSGDGHKLYEQIRTIEGKAKRENRELTPEEAAQVAKLNAQMKGKYDDAFAGATKG